MDKAAGFFTYGLRVSWPLASVSVEAQSLRITSRFVRSISPYARQHDLSDLVLDARRIDSITRRGAVLGWGVAVVFDDGAAIGIVGPGLPRMLENNIGLPMAWDRRPIFWMSAVTRHRTELQDLRDRYSSHGGRS